jgi:cell division septal protein FtsQ
MSPRANIRRAPKKARRPLNLRRMFRIMAVTVVVSGIASAGGWGLVALNRALAVDSWRIEASDSLRAAIATQLQQQPLDFYHTFPPLLRRRLLAAIPALADVQISRSVGGALDIKAVPRQAVANWLDPQGRMQLVDGDGIAYAGTGPNLPILPMLRLPADELPQASALLVHLQQMSHSLFTHLSEMDAIDGSWKLYFDQGESWVIPQTGAIQRVDRLYALMEQPRWHGDAWRVDARMHNRWFIRPARSKEVI